MRVVITGRDGQVVRSLVERAAGTEFEIVPLGRPELDLAGTREAICSAVEQAKPDIIISSAAYTQVDKAESEPDLAFAVNRDGPRGLAMAAQSLSIPLIHLSTDYVFDGSKTSPYVEEDVTGPTGIYGVSKLAGEEAVLAEHENCAVLRTAWVYSPFGNNFVKTMLRLADGRDEIGVVQDQLGNPTSALDIADAVLAIAADMKLNVDPALRGVFHMTGSGSASWADFAEAIFKISAEAGGPTAIVNHIGTADYPTPARRPANSELDSSKLAHVYGLRLPDWHCSLKDVVTRLVQAGARGA